MLKAGSAIFFAALSSLALAAGKGTVEGKVVIDGKIPKLKTSSKKGYSPYASLYKDSGKSGPELPRHLLVYLEGVAGDYKPDEKNPVLGQKDKQFTSDIVPVIKGGKVEVTNSDTVQHHIRSSTKPWAFNLKKRAPGETATVAFENKAGASTGAVPIYCDIHSKMRAHVVVLDNPFYALLEEKGGKFSIKGVPQGTYTLNAFHPTLKFEPFQVTVGKGPVTVTMVGEKD